MANSQSQFKQNLSNSKLNITLGFMYWINEKNHLRGLRGLNIVDYPKRINELIIEYNHKYPQGLTGWNEPGYIVEPIES